MISRRLQINCDFELSVFGLSRTHQSNHSVTFRSQPGGFLSVDIGQVYLSTWDAAARAACENFTGLLIAVHRTRSLMPAIPG